ncbi:hypothetical protein Syun_014221 [Stephania yunnanensis]|uniref:Uncharacterized protein n=1 Tax=Stephania yunnanensis TaxID=152371 RepID=A0AAP0PBP4_9MAGN
MTMVKASSRDLFVAVTMKKELRVLLGFFPFCCLLGEFFNRPLLRENAMLGGALIGARFHFASNNDKNKIIMDAII